MILPSLSILDIVIAHYIGLSTINAPLSDLGIKSSYRPLYRAVYKYEFKSEQQKEDWLSPIISGCLRKYAEQTKEW